MSQPEPETRAFAKVDPGGVTVQVGTIHYPGGVPEQAWSDLQAAVEAEGCTLVEVGAENLPASGSTYDGDTFTAPEVPQEPPALAPLRAKAEKVAAGKASFTAEERDQLDALRLLGWL
jgi:hypothetical protein